MIKRKERNEMNKIIIVPPSRPLERIRTLYTPRGYRVKCIILLVT